MRKIYHQMTKKIVIFVSVVIPLTSQIYPSITMQRRRSSERVAQLCSMILNLSFKKFTAKKSSENSEPLDMPQIITRASFYSILTN